MLRSNNKCRFSLYHLEDNDFFIKDFNGSAQFIHPSNKSEIINLKGNIIFTTKSIIFDSFEENYTLVKFHFRYFGSKPKVTLIGGKDYLKVKVYKTIEIPNIFSNNKSHDYNNDLILFFNYEKIEITLKILFDLYDSFSNKKLNYDMYSEEYLATLYNFKFDYSRVKSIRENFLLKREEFVRIFIPLIEIPGILMISDERLYIQPLFSMNSDFIDGSKFKLKSIHTVYKRYLKMCNSGLEIIAYSDSKKRNKTLLITMKNSEQRNNTYDILMEAIKKAKDEYFKISQDNIKYSSVVETNFDLEKYSKLWIDGAISNYDYLIKLNCAANRTKQDLSQYPVFPWVLNDYTSDVLRIEDDSIYRNLSKPIGALNNQRLNNFLNRYYEMPEPKYLYGTHYSNPAYTVGYLFRKYPQWMLKLNGGKFDHPDRLFSSILSDWKVCNESSSSLKELIPEFYEEDNSFLLNLINVDLGENSDGKKISVCF